jgi:hypothetical protein
MTISMTIPATAESSRYLRRAAVSLLVAVFVIWSLAVLRADARAPSSTDEQPRPPSSLEVLAAMRVHDVEHSGGTRP